MSSNAIVTDKLQLAYAQLINEAIGSPNLGKGATLHLTGLSDGPIPLASVVGENHQRYCVYKLVDDVPQADVPALVHSGQSYFEAYRTYLENTDVPVTDDEAEEDTLLATITKYQTQVDEGISTAKADYTKSLGPDFIDPDTGSFMTLDQFIKKYHPQTKSLEKILNEKSEELDDMTSIDSFSPLSQKLDWIKAWQKGASYSKAVDGFNMPVVALSNGQIDGVAKKNKTDDGTKKKAADTNTQYEPLIQIEGSTFETEAKKWHDTFPKSYPKDLTALDKAQVKGHIDITSNTSTTWQDFGYSKTTTTSGSSGWIFWSDSTTTVTESTTSSIETNVSDFTGGVDIRIWGLNRYPVMYGDWRKGNPQSTFPKLKSGTDSSVKTNVSSFISELIIGYGVELKFNLSAQVTQTIDNVVKTNSKSDGGLSVFGALYSNSNSSENNRTTSFDQLGIDDTNHTVTIKAQNDGIPLVLGAIVTTVEG